MLTLHVSRRHDILFAEKIVQQMKCLIDGDHGLVCAASVGMIALRRESICGLQRVKRYRFRQGQIFDTIR